MPTEETNDSAQGGAPNPQTPAPAPATPPQGAGDPPAAPPPQPTFSAEQQAAVDRIVAERLERERKKQQTAIDKAKADAEAAALAEQGKYKELFEKAQAEAKAAAEQLAQMERDQQRRDAAQAAGIPQLWQRLQGETAEALAEDAKALAAMVQPAAGGGRTATTSPTPPAQSGQQDFVRQAIERQQKRATFNDPYAEMMRR